MDGKDNNINSITDDGSLAALRLPRPEGRKSFHCDKVTQSALVNRTFWVIDYDKDVKTKFGEGKYTVFIKFDLNDSDTAARVELAKLRLEVKDNWQIFPVDDRGIDFVGYKFRHGFTLLRKSIKKSIFHKASRLNHGLIKPESWIRSFASWNGWLKWCDSWRLRLKIENTILKTAKYESLLSK